MQLQVIEVLIGVVAAFFVVSVIASAAVEIGSAWFRKRSKDLWIVIDEMLADGDSSAIDLKKTSVYTAMQAASRRKRRNVEEDKREPSYMSARSFADGVIEQLVNLGEGVDDVEKMIEKLPPGPLKTRIATLRAEFGDDLTLIKSGLEGWFDDVMDRLEGAYKRWSQWILLAVGLVVAAGLNVSTVRIVDSLWNDATLRTAVADSAAANLAETDCPTDGTSTDETSTDEASTDEDAAASCTPGEKLEAAIGDLDDLKLPVGWNDGWEKESGALWTLLGLIPTGLAVMLGAPFWFDLLARLTGARRTRGVPPRAGQDPGSATTEVITINTGGAGAGAAAAGAGSATGRKTLADLTAATPPSGGTG